MITKGRSNQDRWWFVAACPACGGPVMLETEPNTVRVFRVVPEDPMQEFQISHLPPEVEVHWNEVLVVAKVGANRSVVVACGRALEAAAQKLGITHGSLQQRITKMRKDGLITAQFHDAMDYVRLIRNIGAHAEKEVSEDSAMGTIMFTLQALRLLFEVPGELASLKDHPKELDENGGEAGE